MSVLGFTLSRFGVIVLLINPIILMGCQKINQLTHGTASTTASTTTQTASVAASQGTDSAIQPSSSPVVYPIHEWQNQPLSTKIPLEDIEAIKSQLGQTLKTDSKSLDYASSLATKYSFAKEASPYLDLIDSPNYLELQWYFASKTDTHKDKTASIAHAQKAFQLTRNWLGNDGGHVVERMVQGEVITNQLYNGVNVSLARCENYFCNLVIKKPKNATKSVSKNTHTQKKQSNKKHTSE